jgi:glycosyltransferase involved in cell wall biosynthesis
MHSKGAPPKLKVLMLTDYFYPEIGGGVEKVVYEVSKRLVKMGCDVSVITLGSRRSIDTYVVDNVTVYRLPSINITKIVGLQLSLPRNVRGALRIARDFAPDVIHTHNIFFTMSLLAVLIKKICTCRLIVTAHLGDIRNLALTGRGKALVAMAYERLLGYIVLAVSDKIIAVSHAVRQHLLTIGTLSKKVVVIPNGVDLKEFNSTVNTISDRAVNVIFVGRLLPNKGLKYLVEAARLVIDKGLESIKFRIVGDGPFRAQLENLIRQKGLGRYFDFLGKVPSVSEILREGGIFVRPSLTEGMPLTILEAMASRLPVIATRVAGTSELVIQNKTGLLVEPGNVKQLADAILRLANSPEFANRLGQNARAFIERYYKQRYSWEAAASSILSVYKS